VNSTGFIGNVAILWTTTAQLNVVEWLVDDVFELICSNLQLMPVALLQQKMCGNLTQPSKRICPIIEKTDA
jgi:hypothetical protein